MSEAVEPLYRFRFPDGQEGAILARCLDGWAPLVTGDLAARPEPCRSSTSRSGSATPKAERSPTPSHTDAEP